MCSLKYCWEVYSKLAWTPCTYSYEWMHLIDFHFLSTHNIAHFVIQRWYMVSPFTAVFKMRYNFSALNWQGVYKQILTHIEKCSFYYLKSMVFENHPKSRIWIFQFWHFPPIFFFLKLTCLVTCCNTVECEFFCDFRTLCKSEILDFE